MKKHLIAAAVAAAVAVPAMAQVTISGNFEVSHVVLDNSDGVTTKNATDGSFVGLPGMTFRASEDLGGGLKAGVTAELNIEPDAGSTNSTATFAESYIDLSGGFGTIRAGRFSAVGRDAGGVYRFMGDVGRLTDSANPGTFVQQNLAYISPNFSGVQVSASASRGTGVSAATDRAASVGSVMVRYSAGPLNVAYSTVATKGATTAATASRDDSAVDLLAAGYDFGMAKVGVVRMNYDDNADTTKNVTGTAINVAMPMGKYTIGAGIQKYSMDNNSAKKTDMLMFGAKYDLSKRTAIWGTWQQAKAAAGGGATGFLNTRGLGVTAATGKSMSGYGLSLVHNF